MITINVTNECEFWTTINGLVSLCCAHAPNCPGPYQIDVISARLQLRREGVGEGAIFNTLHIRIEVLGGNISIRYNKIKTE